MSSRLALVAAVAAVLAPAPAVAAKTPAHGAVRALRPLTSHAKLTAAARNLYVRYSSVGLQGEPVAVSGTIALPRGKAPKGGWPVLSFAHGTTGIADRCAPSGDMSSSPTSGINPWLNRMLRAGFAVVRTDYEGLGTPGDLPYLNGVSEARSVLDIVRAARRASPAIGKRLVIAGHSEGGHAALWAAYEARRWTPELDLRGTVAFAPASHLAAQAAVMTGLDITAFSPIIGYVLRGIDVARPDLHVTSQLSPRALELWPQTNTLCNAEIGRADSWGGITAKDIFVPDPDLGPAIAYLRSTDPENLRIRGRVMVLQGDKDSTVLPNFTDDLVKQYEARGTKVTYGRYPGLDHGSIATDAASTTAALRYLRARLR